MMVQHTQELERMAIKLSVDIEMNNVVLNEFPPAISMTYYHIMSGLCSKGKGQNACINMGAHKMKEQSNH